MAPPTVFAPPEAPHAGAGPDRTVPAPRLGARDCSCRRPDCAQRFAALAAATGGERHELRNRLVKDHLPLVRSLTARYRRLGTDAEDIRQVASLALVEAVDRFDPGRGSAFSAFAVPTVAGAIKRHFRDASWMLQTPRWLKDLHLHIRAAAEELTHRLGRPPTIDELAAHLDCSEEEIRAGLQASDDRHPVSIDAPVGGVEGEAATLASTIGVPEDGYGHVETIETLRPLLAQLPARERRVIALRFFGNLTQAQIAEDMGCSQMHISRILKTTLDRLRQALRLSGPDTRTRNPRREPGKDRQRAPADVDVPHTKLAESDVDIVACRTGGPDGQHRNKASTAVRATHRPTGTVIAARSSGRCRARWASGSGRC